MASGTGRAGVFAELSAGGFVDRCCRLQGRDVHTLWQLWCGRRAQLPALVAVVALPRYASAVKAGVSSIMVSYSSWNGQKMHGNKHLITDVLKSELGFRGIVVSDWAAIDQLSGRASLCGPQADGR